MAQPAGRYGLLFSVRRSVRFHSHRYQFYVGVESAINFEIVVLGSVPLAKSLSESLPVAVGVWTAFMIVPLASLSLVCVLCSKAALHNELVRSEDRGGMRWN